MTERKGGKKSERAYHIININARIVRSSIYVPLSGAESREEGT